MPDLSILIPSRNEMFLKQTIENVLENMRGDTEILAVCDGSWPDPPIRDHERVHLIYHSAPIGQRAATNEAAMLSAAKFIMKLDAHCAVDEGFDVKLMADCKYDWTVVPRMYNLHAFDWKCRQCGQRRYQGPTPKICEKCDDVADFERAMVWKPKKSPETDFMRFDGDLRFHYWSEYKKRPEAKGDICDLMSCLGACWFMHRDRYWELDGLDERHGSWGQVGTEVACKSWLSGGRMVINKLTWFSHMFRTQGGDFGFPYKIRGSEQEKARQYSKDMWLNNKWPKAKHDLKWLIDKFAPVPDWSNAPVEKRRRKPRGRPVKGVVYYTDNRLDGQIMRVCQKQITRGIKEKHVVSASLKPMEFGVNVVLERTRGILTMFKQILTGLEASVRAKVVFFCEHDILYHPSHFDFVPPREDAFYYNENTWKVCAETGQALFYYCKQTSGLCAWRDVLIEHYRNRIAKVEDNARILLERGEKVRRDGFSQHMGFEPGCHRPPRGVDNYPALRYMSEYPNIDIRHKYNLTPNRWNQDEFRDPKSCLGWTLADEVPGWGRTKDRFLEFLSGLE